jgi:hypothetical protein
LKFGIDFCKNFKYNVRELQRSLQVESRHGSLYCISDYLLSFVIPLFVLHLLRAVAVLSLQAKGCEGVTETEKRKIMKGLARIAEMLPAAKKQYVLGYAEGMAYRKKVKK